MADYRLKMKIGDHEFDAEGPVDVVKSQFETFKQLIAAQTKPDTKNTAVESLAQTVPLSSLAGAPPSIDKIFRVNGRVVSLKVSPNLDLEAVLLILYGQIQYRRNASATGGEVVDGLNESGYRDVRMSRVFSQLLWDNAIIITGKHRAKRYRLTEEGLNRAEQIMHELMKRTS